MLGFVPIVFFFRWSNLHKIPTIIHFYIIEEKEV